MEPSAITTEFEPQPSLPSGDSTEATPRLWLLLDDRPGHTTQVVGLAQLLGWSYEAKHLRFTGINRLSNRLLRASRLSLDTRRSDALTPPWPEVVIAMGRRTAPIARWIKKQSRGRTRLIQLGRKAANVADDFDLTVACTHFQLPAHPKRIDLLLPPTQVTEARLSEAAARWPELFAGAARPRVALLVGGTTAHHLLTAETASRMAQDLEAFARSLGGSLTCVTSRRSGAAVEKALQAGAPGAKLHFWRRDKQENPYFGYLAQADILVVTGESESMLAEATNAAKPLYIYPLPAKPAGWRSRIAGKILSTAQGGEGRAARACRWLIDKGLAVPPRDLVVMHRGMVESDIARYFGDDEATACSDRSSGLEALTRRVRALLESD